MSTIHILYLGNNSVIDVAGLRDEATGGFINNATVSVTLLDQAGEQVDGADWPLALDFLAGSNGNYRATLPYTLAVGAGERYVARIVAIADSGRAQWDMQCVGRVRT